MLKALVVFVSLFLSTAWGAGSSLLASQRCADDTCTSIWIIGPPTQDAMEFYNFATGKPDLLNLGAMGETLAGVGTASDARTAINAFAVPAGTTAQYVRGDGTLGTLPAIPATPSQSSASRTLNSAFQVSTSRGAFVFYSVQATITASIAGGQNGDVILEIANDSGFTSGVQTVSISGTGQTYTLAIALQGVQPQTGVVSGYVPASMWVRLRPVSNTGSPTFAYRAGQEVLV